MRITINEIAKIAGVSKATVSRVLNNADGVSEQTRQRVQKIITSMNYSLNQTTSPDCLMRSRSVALVLPDISNPFFAELTKTISNIAQRHDYIAIIANTEASEENELRYIKSLVAKKVDGIILVPAGTSSKPEHFMPAKCGIKMVLLDRKLPGLEVIPGVFSDNEYASFKSCEILIQNGSRRIAYLSGPENAATAKERLEGYKNALKQYGIGINPLMIRTGDYTIESGYNGVIALESEGTRYSALMAANDMMAIGAIKALRELSYDVPNDVEIIGFDNINFAQHVDPPLSTVQQPTAEMGRRAMEMLLDMIDGKKITESIRLQPRILLRKTTRQRIRRP